MTVTLEKSLLEYFQGKKLSLRIYPESIEKDFQGDLQYFIKFMRNQEEFWGKYRSGKCGDIHKHFQGIINHLNTAVRYQNNNFHQAKVSIDNAINTAGTRNWVNTYSETDIARFITERYSIHPSQADAAIDYFLTGQGYSSNISNKEYLNGIIHCFIWDEQNNGLKRKLHAPKQALLQLKETFSKDRDELYGDFKNKSKEIHDLFISFENEILQWKNEIVATTEKFVKEKESELTSVIEEKNKVLSDMETLYKENLRLEGPATYWESLYEHYQQRGHQWRKWAIGTSILFSAILICLLYFNPTALFPNGAFTVNSLKATIILAIISSIAIYLIRLFVLLSTSAYHLARDAKERFQLTYVYLSLIQEKGVSEADRTIILQSLFSRADTGLLKGDSGPTIPDGTLSQLIKNIQK